MSRIGKLPIPVPKAVTATVQGQEIKIKGAKGELALTLVDAITAKLEDGEITLTPRDEEKRTRALWGMQRSLIANMIEGVQNGFERSLELKGVGYRAQMQGAQLKLSLGFSHEIIYEAPKGVKVETPKATEIKISGVDKQAVGQAAAEIRGFRPPEPYKGKGVMYAGEHVRRKEGKKK